MGANMPLADPGNIGLTWEEQRAENQPVTTLK